MLTASLVLVHLFAVAVVHALLVYFLVVGIFLLLLLPLHLHKFDHVEVEAELVNFDLCYLEVEIDLLQFGLFYPF